MITGKKRQRPIYPKLKPGQAGQRSDGALVIRETSRKISFLPDDVYRMLYKPKQLR